MKTRKTNSLMLGAVVLGFTTLAQAAEYKCLVGQITQACLADKINKANANPDHDVIVLGAGHFRLTKALPVVRTPITIVGMGGGTTFIHGSCPDGPNKNPRTGCSGVAEFSVLEVASTGSLELDALCVRDGQADSGGGILNKGSLAIYRSTIKKNHAWAGGGIFSEGPSLTVSDTTVTGNAAKERLSSGGIHSFDGVAWIGHSTINSNVGGSGGGIFNGYEGEVNIYDSTVSGNKADAPESETFNAGGIVNHGVMWLKNVTITANIGPPTSAQTGEWFAGGVFNTGAFHFANTIIAVNKRNSLPSDFGCVEDEFDPNKSGMFSYGGNLVGANTDGSTCKLEKPSWNPDWPARKADKVVTNRFSIFEGGDQPLLKDNGGTSCTHALKLGSPALDMAWTGQPGQHPFACEQYDQRWAERPNTMTGTGCDAGAFERTGQVQPSGLGCK